MFRIEPHRRRRFAGVLPSRNLSRFAILLTLAALLWFPALAAAQTAQAPSAAQPPKPAQQPPPAEAGGPGGDIGPIAVPKKKTEEAPPEKPRLGKPPAGMPEYSVRVDVPLVNVDVSVVTKDGQFIPGLKKENFRVLEDGVPQRVSNFSQSEAPITAVLLVEFASTYYQFIYDMLNASYSFVNSLKPDDWVALVTYDMRPEIMVDFTQDKRALYAGLNRLRIPGFRETNLYDALYDTLDRIDSIEGRKYIILVASGYDSFSRINYDKILKKIQATPNVSIFTVSTGWILREWLEAHGLMGSIARLDFLQADNQMSTFARLTGGRHYQPRFEGEMREIFADVAATIRNQYNLAYRPSNSKQDGSYRKLKVELVGPNGEPLKVVDQKGKQLKYTIIAREGYKAKQVVE